MARNKQTGPEIKLYQIDTMVYLSTKNIITKLSMFAEFLREGCVSLADHLSLNRARALERFDKNYKSSDIKELSNIDGQANETWLRKNGLLYSAGGRYELSPIANAILRNDISLRDYCFLLLSKQWIKVKELGGQDEYKKNTLAFILEELSSHGSIPVTDFISHLGDVVLTKYKDDYKDLSLSNQEAARFLIEPLLISGIMEESNESYIIPSKMKDLANDFIAGANSIRKITEVDCIDEEYWNSFQYGLYDIVNDTNKSLYSKYYPDLFSLKQSLKIECESPLQQISYGAPGTGKSYSIKSVIAKHCGLPVESIDLDAENIFRTTFHPDYDYAQFVGCYKPTKIKSTDYVSVNSKEEYLTELSKINCGEEGEKVCKRINLAYNNLEFAEQCVVEMDKSVDKSSYSDTRNGINLAKLHAKTGSSQNSSITYEFTPQVFTNAFVKAYESDGPVYLVIEEINRGNCAQIFGDIFQLLDRNSDTGESEYSISVDDDLKTYLQENCPNSIKNGKIKLPRNLSIIATMNTSDQSLFPMDSAFKRRWEWVYMPIMNAGKNWKIEVSDKYAPVDWWNFLEHINAVVSDLTLSEDKQLGYFFCKPDAFVEKDETKRQQDAKYDLITAKTFVGKVIFYLWNDVFKDYAFDHKCCKDDKQKEILFAKFYSKDGKSANEEVLEQFFENLQIENDPNPLLESTGSNKNGTDSSDSPAPTDVAENVDTSDSATPVETDVEQ